MNIHEFEYFDYMLKKKSLKIPLSSQWSFSFIYLFTFFIKKKFGIKVWNPLDKIWLWPYTLKKEKKKVKFVGNHVVKSPKLTLLH